MQRFELLTNTTAVNLSGGSHVGDMWHVMRGTEMHTGIWWGKLKERPLGRPGLRYFMR